MGSQRLTRGYRGAGANFKRSLSSTAFLRPPGAAQDPNGGGTPAAPESAKQKYGQEVAYQARAHAGA
jgi:hypothetical protein